MPAIGCCAPASHGRHGARTSPPGHHRARSRCSTPGWPAPATAARCSASFTVRRHRRRRAPTERHPLLDARLRQRLTRGSDPQTGGGDTPVGTLGGMSRDRAPFVAQGTWRSGTLHVWGWNGDSSASAAWLYGGFGRSRWTAQADAERGMARLADLVRRARPADARAAERRPATGAGGAARSVRRRRLAVRHAARRDALSPSLAWFAALTRFAVHVVGAGRVTPEVSTRVRSPSPAGARCSPTSTATRSPTPPPSRPRSAATARAPSTDDIVDTLVDGLARAVLHHGGWKPDLGRKRSRRRAGGAGRVRGARQARPGRPLRRRRVRRGARSTSPHASTVTGAASTASRSCADACG